MWNPSERLGVAAISNISFRRAAFYYSVDCVIVKEEIETQTSEISFQQSRATSQRFRTAVRRIVSGRVDDGISLGDREHRRTEFPNA